MGLKEQQLTDYKEAMKAHDSTRKETVNLIRAAIKQHEIDQQVTLEDADIVPIIKKQLKMRTDAIADFEKAGRQDLLDSYRTEIDILKQYLPEEMSEEAVRAAVERICEESGLDRSMKSMGPMMKAAMAELKGQADGAVVSKVVKEYLSEKQLSEGAAAQWCGGLFFIFLDFSGRRVPMLALASVSLQILTFSAVHHTRASKLNGFLQGAQFVKVSASMGTLQYVQPLICDSFKKFQEIGRN